MSKKPTVTIRGRTYNLDDVGDITSIQNILVSENWNGSKRDGVALFLSLQNMLSMQLKRHLAANFKMVMKTAMEEGAEERGKAQVALSFAFTIDMTAPTVATIAAHKLGFSVKHETKGKPQTHDLNQGEFLDEDMGVVFDVKGFEKENSAPPDEPQESPALPPADTDGEVTPESENDADTPPKKKKRAKKD